MATAPELIGWRLITSNASLNTTGTNYSIAEADMNDVVGTFDVQSSVIAFLIQGTPGSPNILMENSAGTSTYISHVNNSRQFGPNVAVAGDFSYRKAYAKMGAFVDETIKLRTASGTQTGYAALVTVWSEPTGGWADTAYGGNSPYYVPPLYSVAFDSGDPMWVLADDDPFVLSLAAPDPQLAAADVDASAMKPVLFAITGHEDAGNATTIFTPTDHTALIEQGFNCTSWDNVSDASSRVDLALFEHAPADDQEAIDLSLDYPVGATSVGACVERLVWTYAQLIIPDYNVNRFTPRRMGGLHLPFDLRNVRL